MTALIVCYPDLKAFISQQRNNALQAAPSNIVITVKPADEVEQLIQKSSKSTAQELTAKVKPFREAPVDRLSQWFSGREQELDKLHKYLQSHEADASSSCVIYGMPGVGKSELALRFAQLMSNNNEYAYVMWISASTIEKLTQGVDSLIDLLNLPYLSDIDQKARLLAVRRWLETHDDKPSGRWLMIFDNVQKSVLDTLRDLIPRTHDGGSIIFTTKNEQIASILASHGTHQHKILELEPPNPDEAATFLCRAAGIGGGEVNATLRAQAEALVNTMGRLPLAVENVASFMRQAKYSIDDFSNLYKSQHKMKVR
jgi:NB-ARC domain